MSIITAEELSKHNTKDSCWIAIHGKVYDLTKFASAHPGGASILYKYGGKDATEEFDGLHSKSVLEAVNDQVKGTLSGDAAAPKSTQQQNQPQQQQEQQLTVHHMVNTYDFLPIAEQNMTKQGWIYYAYGSENEDTLRENEAAFRRYIFRPRVCVDVSRIDTRTKILGFESSYPLFMCGAALQGLAHPDGEVGIARACYHEGVIQMVPTFSSKTLEEIQAAKGENQVQFFQLYINSDRSQSERLLKKVEALGYKAVFVTVDAPKLGRREKDMRSKYVGQLSTHHDEKTASSNRGAGIAMALNSYIAANVTWDDIAWVKRIVPNMKVVLKGVQRGDDAVKAVEVGCDGILLSNHGGRQIDTGRSGVEILVEVAQVLREKGLFDKVELYVDGGIRRGNDIAKCLALGARAVGVSRPVILAMGAFGQAGAEKALQIMRAELQNTMGLLGARNVSEITPDMLMERAGNSGVRIISHL
eukprot:PhF_6_TR37210/c0_g1_i1/m.54857/K00101/lldD; L-lactate dehydrogenase (cytochrome)